MCACILGYFGRVGQSSLKFATNEERRVLQLLLQTAEKVLARAVSRLTTSSELLSVVSVCPRKEKLQDFLFGFSQVWKFSAKFVSNSREILGDKLVKNPKVQIYSGKPCPTNQNFLENFYPTEKRKIERVSKIPGKTTAFHDGVK